LINPDSLNFIGKTTLQDIVILARQAFAAVGNDCGPMHMIAPTGCPSLVVFSKHSTPDKHAPRGSKVACIQHDFLDSLCAEDVMDQLLTLCEKNFAETRENKS
jgi:ADP-heptose:LPS heptosyltransferase